MLKRTRPFVRSLALAGLFASAAAGIANAEPLTPGVYAEPAVAPGLFAPLAAPITSLLQGTSGGSTTLISQVGVNNNANANVTGSGSLSLTAQTGSNNRSYQAIEGNSSALLLSEGGTNNNVLQVAKGDRNLQLVGVSGRNNQIAYIQSGNDLAGALDVRNSTNSAVIALQTDQSAHFLMPTGLRGLNNQVVVIVPGRMYVLPRPH